MRIIDADELKEGLRGHFKDVMGNFVFNTTFAEIESIIDMAPTVTIDNKVYSQGFKDGKECTLVSIDAIEDITDRMISIISEMDWEKLLKEANKRPQGEWIPVSERLPEESLNSVIGWDAYRERCVFVQYIDRHFQIMGSDESFNIVAWMPLPEPYKEEDND